MKRNAVLACLLVALIWGSSMVLVKMALVEMDPMTLAGLRYSIASIVLLPFLGKGVRRIQRLSPHAWAQLVLLGVGGYAVANFAIFKSMEHLPVTMGSMGMNLLPIIVLLIGMSQLHEIPQRSQWLGMAIAVVGTMCFFTLGNVQIDLTGLIFLSVGVLGQALFSVIGRQMASESGLHAIELTAIPLGIGGTAILLLALATKGMPEISLTSWWMVFWMALVNTAVAYGLYNFALRALRAFEVNALLNLSTLASAGLAWILFGETLARGQIFGMASLICGVVIVQHGAA